MTCTLERARSPVFGQYMRRCGSFTSVAQAATSYRNSSRSPLRSRVRWSVMAHSVMFGPDCAAEISGTQRAKLPRATKTTRSASAHDLFRVNDQHSRRPRLILDPACVRGRRL